MVAKLTRLLSGDGLQARAMRGYILSIGTFGAHSLLRLGSNVVLTWLLFPEAFGLMALVSVVLFALEMFADMGLGASIIQSKRGDDPVFLNTVWTMGIVRGLFLWAGACAFAWPAAVLYDEAILLQLIPVAGLNGIIGALGSTNVITANRNLYLGRITILSLFSKLLGTLGMIWLAWWWQSVWALVFGSLMINAITSALSYVIVPGIRNRLCWEWDTFWEVFNFGKFILLTTIAGVMGRHGDRAILGLYISIVDLGVFSIGALLGKVVLDLNKTANNKLLFPLYRMRPPAENVHNRAAMLKARRLVILGSLFVCVLFAFGGIALIDALYDARYVQAGPIVVLLSFAILPKLVTSGYNNAFLSQGDSRSAFLEVSATITVQIIVLFVGIQWFGIFGAIIAVGIANLATYPIRAVLARRYEAWDPWGDAIFLAIGGVLNGTAVWIHWDAISGLIG